MAKDRNTFAKRQREVEKKRKANEKRSRRAIRKQSFDEPESVEDPSDELSTAELSVLKIFRKYLMTPGKMFCFSNLDYETFKGTLTLLTQKGLLVAEKPVGGFSLTDAGFDAMEEE